MADYRTQTGGALLRADTKTLVLHSEDVGQSGDGFKRSFPCDFISGIPSAFPTCFLSVLRVRPSLEFPTLNFIRWTKRDRC